MIVVLGDVLDGFEKLIFCVCAKVVCYDWYIVNDSSSRAMGKNDWSKND
jgi:hypothetical protein